MQHAVTLAPSDRTAIEVSLSRLTGDLFGSISTLPLYCFGQLPSDNPADLINAHYEIWHSCLIVVREVLKGTGDTADAAHATLTELSQEIERLRQAYVQLQKSVESATFRDFEAVYETIPHLVRDLCDELELDPAFLPGSKSLRSVTFQRSLRWLKDEIGHRAGQAQQG